MKRKTDNTGSALATRHNMQKAPAGTFAFCYRCMARYSADAGDYFYMPDNEPLRCCDTTMVLARESRSIDVVCV